MADGSRIEWTEATWNPVTGCTKVSPGCDNCYAETIHERFHGKGSFAVVDEHPDRLDLPLTWRKPRRVFVNSMSDLFHADVSDGFIVEVFARMWWAPQHTFQVLTKRHGRMRSLMPRIESQLRERERDLAMVDCPVPLRWPLPNVWLGVSVENQRWATLRIPALLATPAAVRWLSCEPLLGPVALGRNLDRLDWIVVGGESGPKARPMQPSWATSVRDQCVGAGVPFFFKQWGAWVAPDHMPEDAFMAWDSEHGTGAHRRDEPWRVGKKWAGRLLDGRTWDEYPAAVA